MECKISFITDISSDTVDNSLNMSPTMGEMASTEMKTEVLSTALHEDTPVVVGDDADVRRFLGTPLRIGTYDTNATYNINPWSLFLLNPAVARKVANYLYIRGTINMRATINGNPYYYGRSIIAWTSEDTPGTRNTIYQFYNMNHVLIDPSTQDVKDIVIQYPFVTPDDLPTPAKSLFVTIAPFATFSDATSAVAPVLQITLYFWLTDVELSIPIPMAQNKLSDVKAKVVELQGNKLVSNTLNSVSKAANHLTQVPIIGPFATTFGMVAKMGYEWAKMFGFSKPVDIRDKDVVIERYFPNLASTDGLDPVARLTTDSKQTRVIDYGFLTGNDMDEMTIAFITQRPSVLTVKPLATGQAVNTVLYRFGVNPCRVPYDGVSTWHFTNLCFVSSMFSSWRGSLIYTFTPVKTVFHRGKIRFYWNNTNPALVEEVTNVTPSVVLDLAVDNSVELTVAWNENTYWLTNKIADINSIPAITGGLDNGYVTAIVAEQLTAPLSTQGVKIIVTVRAGSDFMLAYPTMSMIKDFHIMPQTSVANANFPSTTSSKYNYVAANVGNFGTAGVPTPESGLIADTSRVKNFSIGSQVDSTKVAQLTQGEAIVSLRSLLHRYYPAMAIAPVSDGTSGPLRGFAIPRMVPSRGSYGVDGFVQTMNHPISYLASAYMWSAGATRVKILPVTYVTAGNTGNIAPSCMSLRTLRGTALFNTLYTPTSAQLRSTFTDLSWWSNAHAFDFSGVNVTTNVEKQAVEIPARAGIIVEKNISTLSPYTTSTCIDCFVEEQSCTHLSYDVYMASSDDFSLVGYVGPPVMYSYYNKAV